MRQSRSNVSERPRNECIPAQTQKFEVAEASQRFKAEQ